MAVLSIRAKDLYYRKCLEDFANGKIVSLNGKDIKCVTENESIKAPIDGDIHFVRRIQSGSDYKKRKRKNNGGPSWKQNGVVTKIKDENNVVRVYKRTLTLQDEESDFKLWEFALADPMTTLENDELLLRHYLKDKPHHHHQTIKNQNSPNNSSIPNPMFQYSPVQDPTNSVNSPSFQSNSGGMNGQSSTSTTTTSTSNLQSHSYNSNYNLHHSYLKHESEYPSRRYTKYQHPTSYSPYSPQQTQYHLNSSSSSTSNNSNKTNLTPLPTSITIQQSQFQPISPLFNTSTNFIPNVNHSHLSNHHNLIPPYFQNSNVTFFGNSSPTNVYDHHHIHQQSQQSSNQHYHPQTAHWSSNFHDHARLSFSDNE